MHDWPLVAVYGGAALVASLASALAGYALGLRHWWRGGYRRQR